MSCIRRGLVPLPFSGDYTQDVTLVPIPNTTVKLLGPMIVPTSAKVGHCRNLSKDLQFVVFERDNGCRFFKDSGNNLLSHLWALSSAPGA